MRFVIINTMVQASKRLKSSIQLKPPTADEMQTHRRDRTGFILALFAIGLAVAILLMA
jgi:hypothetical protein